MTTTPGAPAPVIMVTPSVPGLGRVELRVTPHLANELEEMLRGQDPELYSGRKLELSAAVSLAVVLAAAGPALKHLAPVLAEFMRRHKDAEIQYGENGEITSIKGGSLREMQGIVERNAAHQRQIDEQWDQVQGRPSPAADERALDPGNPG